RTRRWSANSVLVVPGLAPGPAQAAKKIRRARQATRRPRLRARRRKPESSGARRHSPVTRNGQEPPYPNRIFAVRRHACNRVAMMAPCLLRGEAFTRGGQKFLTACRGGG